MLRVIYTSIAKQGLAFSEVEDILKKSEINNKRDNISGVLIYGPKMFIQVIEGSDEKIHGLMNKLKKDDRHSGIELLYQSRIKARCFENWSMGLIYFSEKPNNTKGFTDYNTIFEKSNITPNAEGKFITACLKMLGK